MGVISLETHAFLIKDLQLSLVGEYEQLPLIELGQRVDTLLADDGLARVVNPPLHGQTLFVLRLARTPVHHHHHPILHPHFHFVYPHEIVLNLPT